MIRRNFIKTFLLTQVYFVSLPIKNVFASNHSAASQPSVASTPSTPSEASELSELSTPSTPSGPEELVIVENESQLEATTIESIANIENQLVASDGLTAVSEENIVLVLESFN